MMTSDSDESDYEDARQHHDSAIDDNNRVDQPATVAENSLSTSSNVDDTSSTNPVVSNDNLNNGESSNRNSQEIVQPQQALAGERDIPDVIAEAVENQQNVNPPQQPEDDVGERPILPGIPVVINNENNQGLLRHLQGYFNREFPNAIVVDSDDDDVETISDDSDNDLDFPMLDDDEGERGGATSDENEAAAEVDADDDIQDFDPELPIRHAYLGEGMEELQGRVVLEEDATLEIPLIAMGIHLIPGQTLPLTIFHAVFQNAIRRCVMTDRLFGIVHNDMELSSGNVVYKGALGTLAEIFEYQEESEGNGRSSMSSSFALKAKGRQRFNVVEVRRQADGNLMGKVRIRPEIKLEPFVMNILLPGTSRAYLPKYHDELDATATTVNNDNEAVGVVTLSSTPSRPTSAVAQSHLSTPRRDSMASTVSVSAQSDKDLVNLKFKIQDQRKRLKYYAALTTHPYFVYEHYDDTVLVEKVHRLLKTELKGLTESRGKIPTEATELSFWLAQNLTMDDSHRTKILKMDSPIQRLRYELELLARTTKVISCRNCQTNIADQSQIFSMSIEGPQGTYVNPHGFVHETMTVYKAKELIMRGPPSTEASWFPGYSWTIVECKRCKSHIGWKFQAVGKLKPARFWGLARRSVIFKYDFGSDSDIQESLESHHRTPPNSANSDGFATIALF